VTARAEIGVFGGSGFDAFLDGAELVRIETPYGEPSDAVAIAEVAGRRVAFLPRHGRGHRLPPHRIPYRANVWAMRELGVARILAPCAAGSLDPRVRPGAFVVLDQFVDRTSGRACSFHDGPGAVHVGGADPYCPDLRRALIDAGAALGLDLHPAGTAVVVEGPRFSTRAESQWYRTMGWQVINMTGYPEAILARELGLCYASVALITDYDTGVDEDPEAEPVNADMVLEVFRANLDRLRSLLETTIGGLGAPPDGDPCPRALEGAVLGGENR
jgi:5'-methylthioadenosine phosphorylase